MRRRFGKIAVVPAKESQHRSKALRRQFGRDGDAMFVYLLRGQPYPNIVEEH